MPLSVTPRSVTTTDSWRDTATNWITLDGLTDDALNQLVSNAVVTATIRSVDALTTIGPFTLAAVSGKPGAYEVYVTSSVFRVDTAVQVEVRALYGDAKLAVFNKTLMVTP